MKKFNKLLLSLTTITFCLTQNNTNSLLVINSKQYSNVEEDDSEEEDVDFEYNGFLDEIFDASLIDDDITTTFYGTSDTKYANVSFETTYNNEEKTLYLTYETNGYIYKKIQDVYINDKGLLDAEIEFSELDDSNVYQLSEYTDLEDMQNIYQATLEQNSKFSIKALSLFSNFVAVVITITCGIVINVNYKRQTEINYTYNKQLEDDDNGLDFGRYIYDQTGSEDANNCDKYQFGYTTFSGVGCQLPRPVKGTGLAKGPIPL